uniref:Uncharacterized protein n=1 Tax=Anguilla anguilla TaxID=7936 RepID=A0A0E9V6N0_ANGAN
MNCTRVHLEEDKDKSFFSRSMVVCLVHTRVHVEASHVQNKPKCGFVLSAPNKVGVKTSLHIQYSFKIVLDCVQLLCSFSIMCFLFFLFCFFETIYIFI